MKYWILILGLLLVACEPQEVTYDEAVEQYEEMENSEYGILLEKMEEKNCEELPCQWTDYEKTDFNFCSADSDCEFVKAYCGCGSISLNKEMGEEFNNERVERFGEFCETSCLADNNHLFEWSVGCVENVCQEFLVGEKIE